MIVTLEESSGMNRQVPSAPEFIPGNLYEMLTRGDFLLALLRNDLDHLTEGLHLHRR